MAVFVHHAPGLVCLVNSVNFQLQSASDVLAYMMPSAA